MATNQANRCLYNSEIQLLQNVILPWKEEDAEIIFEYNIPCLGKHIIVRQTPRHF